MDLKQFATDCGVQIIECDASVWGGSVGYREMDFKNISYNGFKNEEQAYKHWLKGTFGEQTSKGILKLIRNAQPKLKRTNQGKTDHG